MENINYKNCVLTSLILLLLCCALVLTHLIYPIPHQIIDMLVIMVPTVVALFFFSETQLEEYRKKLVKENNVIVVALKEIEKNKQWCTEYIQCVTPSLKFYKPTNIGIKRCLNALEFHNEDAFLEALYMSLKEIGIVNNIIDAMIITQITEYNVNLVNVSKNAICESEKLEIFLRQRIEDNKRKIRDSILHIPLIK